MIDVRTAGARDELEGDLGQLRVLFLKHELTPESRDTDMNGWWKEGKAEFKFANFPTIRIAETEQLPSDTHYLFCQPMLAGYSLYQKSYKIYSIDNLEAVNPNDGE